MSRWKVIRSKQPFFSWLIDRRALRWLFLFIVIAWITFVISVGVGAEYIAPWNVLKSIFGAGEASETLIVMKFRLPRILTSFLVGAALAGAGALLQAVIRNPLASPDLIGITSGASVSAVFFLVFLEQVSIQYLPLVAIIGAILVTFLLYFLAWKKGVSPIRLVLVGIGIHAFMQAGTQLLLVMTPIIHNIAKAHLWLTGTVYGSGWPEVTMMSIWLLVLIPITIWIIPKANMQLFHDDLAISLGSKVEQTRWILLLLVAAYTGVAVSMGGPIVFIGLIAPHIARRLVGPFLGMLFPLSLVTGGLIVMIADLIARSAFYPLDLPVGIFTSLIGVPFFLYLLRKVGKVKKV
ncbi:FecCD family ABC transporter permease [Thermoflavimicrobium daqui]|uniref:Iron ABC transporter permease n=1 Tax=Thermoflavimicrobium daqui TaxID=2137476 RepID=A0A364K137_9BACL|nr:iron ABC transporter permease [Thermoflavimicrobium daqui]RAL21108.1 iron ABC transporter permease [Thermoflavimicrobium daqui]